jgi:hypothetical protein
MLKKKCRILEIEAKYIKIHFDSKEMVVTISFEEKKTFAKISFIFLTLACALRYSVHIIKYL